MGRARHLFDLALCRLLMFLDSLTRAMNYGSAFLMLEGAFGLRSQYDIYINKINRDAEPYYHCSIGGRSEPTRGIYFRKASVCAK
ncbi:uncharacterized protein BDW70DRAFT_96551 [Aspergillus foveolatus]|uniref:uncharacterized protein n=1 Tax=Aspergillus foveolatus TaxID=210207 RepID=UPI003CCDE2AF